MSITLTYGNYSLTLTTQEQIITLQGQLVNYNDTATAAGIATIIHVATEKTPLVNADEISFWDSVSTVLRKITYANLKASLKIYFDTLYQVVMGADDNYVTDAQLTVIQNTSGTNTGDNATNSQYSGLATSKEDVLTGSANKATIHDDDRIIGLNSESSNVTSYWLWSAIKTFLTTAFNSVYQAVLVSGTNIKTINSTSLLGSGDIVISGGGSPVYYDIGTAADNEINLLVADNICDVVGFTVATTGAVNYIVKVYGAAGALISTVIVRSGTAVVINIPVGLGVDSTTGFTSYKVNISSTAAITQFTITAAEVNRKGVLKAKFGTTGLTTLSAFLKDCYNLNECVLPATLASVTTAANAFNGCYKLATLTLTTSMALCTAYNLAFANCQMLTSVTIPSDSTGITTLEQCFINSYKLTTVTLPTVLNSLTTLSRTFEGCYKLTTVNLPTSLSALTTITGCVAGCRSLITLTLPTTLSAITGTMSNPFLDCVSLATLSECTNWGTNQLTISTNYNLLALTSFDQSALRVAKLDLQGLNALVPNALTYIDIDYANSSYGGAAPQLDFDYCNLDATELNRIFTALPTAAKTISIIGNPGTATCDTSIATGKTWTVTTS